MQQSRASEAMARSGIEKSREENAMGSTDRARGAFISAVLAAATLLAVLEVRRSGEPTAPLCGAPPRPPFPPPRGGGGAGSRCTAEDGHLMGVVSPRDGRGQRTGRRHESG